LKIREILAIAEERLRNGGVESPELEARWIVEFVFGKAFIGLFNEVDYDDSKTEQVDRYIDRRLDGEPLQLVLGEWDFFGRAFAFERGVFIPRPETEGLVELALRYLADYPAVGFEFGIGSGAISVSLLCERPQLRMVAIDVNPLALELSRKNASKHGVEDRLELLPASEFEAGEERFDFVIGNPPYILSSEMAELPREVRYDPPEALDGGEDGLREIRKIIDISKNGLKSGGFILIEIHEKKAVETSGLFTKGFSKTKIFRDLAGKDRYLLAFKE